MEKEYSIEVRGKVHAYRFSDWEKNIIAEGVKPAIKKLEKKIEKIINNPKNEGQATYSCQIDEIQNGINELNDIVKEFESRPA